jgi:hypothetical protein
LVKTPGSRSSALLRSVTRCDHRFFAIPCSPQALVPA